MSFLYQVQQKQGTNNQIFFLAFYENVDAESTYLFAEKVKEKLRFQI